MRYMLFIKHTEDYRAKTPPPALMKAMGEFVMPNMKSGKFIEAAGLMSTWRGKKVQLRDGKVRVVDGPFTESKEIIGGYTLVGAAAPPGALRAARPVVGPPRLAPPRAGGGGERRPPP